MFVPRVAVAVPLLPLLFAQVVLIRCNMLAVVAPFRLLTRCGCWAREVVLGLCGLRGWLAQPLRMLCTPATLAVRACLV